MADNGRLQPTIPAQELAERNNQEARIAKLRKRAKRPIAEVKTIDQPDKSTDIPVNSPTDKTHHKQTPLNPKQQEFVHAYTDKDNPKTYSNGTQSALIAYKSSSNNVAAAQASVMLRSPKIRREIERIYEARGLGVWDRAQITASIAKGTSRKVTKQYTVKDGKRVLKGVTVADHSARDKLQAIDMVNKLTGLYDVAHEAVKAEAEEYRALVKAVFKKGRGGGNGAPKHTKGSLIPSTPRGVK